MDANSKVFFSVNIVALSLSHQTKTRHFFHHTHRRMNLRKHEQLDLQRLVYKLLEINLGIINNKL